MQDMGDFNAKVEEEGVVDIVGLCELDSRNKRGE